MVNYLFFDFLIYELFSLITMTHVNKFPKLEKIFYGKISFTSNYLIKKNSFLKIYWSYLFLHNKIYLIFLLLLHLLKVIFVCLSTWYIHRISIINTWGLWYNKIDWCLEFCYISWQVRFQFQIIFHNYRMYLVNMSPNMYISSVQYFHYFP